MASWSEKRTRDMLDRVRTILARESEHLDYTLSVPEDGYVKHGDWLDILVCPSRAGLHASDYAEVLGRIERSLRDDGINDVLLVPGQPLAA